MYLNSSFAVMRYTIYGNGSKMHKGMDTFAQREIFARE